MVVTQFHRGEGKTRRQVVSRLLPLIQLGIDMEKIRLISVANCRLQNNNRAIFVNANLPSFHQGSDLPKALPENDGSQSERF